MLSVASLNLVLKIDALVAMSKMDTMLSLKRMATCEGQVDPLPMTAMSSTGLPSRLLGIFSSDY